jgi:hypothetical protein
MRIHCRRAANWFVRFICRTDRGRRDWLGPPSLRTVQAGLPHTALQSVVLPLRGLARQLMGRFQAMQPLFGKEGIGPAIVI